MLRVHLSMHRCNFIILDVGTVLRMAGMFLNTFHRDKNFEKRCSKNHRKNRSITFQWSLIVSIIQTFKFYVELYFQNDVPDS